MYLWDVFGYNIEVEVEVEHDLHVRRIESRPPWGKYLPRQTEVTLDRGGR